MSGVNETNVERLARIKSKLASNNLCNAPRLHMGWPYKQIHEDDATWLIELAERAQEFEKLYDEQLEESQSTYEHFKSEIKRLREAIILSLEKHKWNNEESARILEQALEGFK